MKPLNEKAEAEHLAQLHELAYNAMLELRDTLDPKYDALSMGYGDANYARLTIVQSTARKMANLSATHLHKYG